VSAEAIEWIDPAESKEGGRRNDRRARRRHALTWRRRLARDALAAPSPHFAASPIGAFPALTRGIFPDLHFPLFVGAGASNNSSIV